MNHDPAPKDSPGWVIPLSQFDDALGSTCGVRLRDYEQMIDALRDGNHLLLGCDIYAVDDNRSLRHLADWCVEHIGTLWFRNLSPRERALAGVRNWLSGFHDDTLIVVPVVQRLPEAEWYNIE